MARKSRRLIPVFFLLLTIVLLAGFPGQSHAAAPYLVKDLNSSGSSSPNLLTNVNGTLYFTISSGPNADKLFKSNGTAAGTTSFGPSFSFYQTPMTASNGNLFFIASDGTNGGSAQLWKSDGTDSGTLKLFDPAPTSNTSLYTATPAVDVNGTVFFVTSSYDAATNSPTYQLWQTDGTVAGTTQISISYNAALPGAPSDPPGITNLTNVNGTLFFVVPGTMSTPGGLPGSGAGLSLWTYSGGTAQSVYQAGPGNNLAMNPELANVNGILYFAIGSELWKSDGTYIGTTLVKNDFSGSVFIQSLTNCNGTLFFIVNGTELWNSDGTSGGTTLVKSFISGIGGSWPFALVNVNGVLYFAADDGSGSGKELWKSDGTVAGTTLVKDILPGPDGSNISSLINLKGTLFFVASDVDHGTELWKSDGTDTGTVLVSDIYPGATGSNPYSLTAVDNTLFFVADDGVNGKELWAVKENPVILQATPNFIAFGVTPVNTTVTRNVTISNNGDTPLIVTAISIDGATPADNALFTVTAGTCTTLTPTIAAGSSCVVAVSFSPLTGGDRTSSLSIAASGVGVTPLSVSLTGSGLLPTVTLTVDRDGAGSGQVLLNPSGVPSVNFPPLPGGMMYDYTYGDKVVLTATADTDSAWSVWTGCDSISGVTCTVTLTGDRSVKATFVKLVSVTVQTSPEGLAFSVDGVRYNSTQTFTWDPKNTHSLSAIAHQTTTGGIKYLFSDWSDAGAITHTIADPLNSSYTASFIPTQYQVTTTTKWPDGRVVPPVLSNWVDSGQPFKIVLPQLVTGYHIASVSIDGSIQTITDPKSFSYTFDTVMAPHTVVETLGIDTFAVTTIAGDNGTISDGRTVNYGSSIEIQVKPNPGFHILRILVDGSSRTITNPQGFTFILGNITAARTVSALFTSIDHASPPAPIPRTSQNSCYDTLGATIDCVGTRQDGALQMGVVWPDPRFSENADQTVLTDTLTGLEWSKDANPGGGGMTWQQALDYIKTLNSQNYLGHNDWRLPNSNQLASLIYYGQPTSLENLGFVNVTYEPYWSSTPAPQSQAVVALPPSGMWISNFNTPGSVLPVRVGQAIGSFTIPKTGITTCYDFGGNTINCSGTGQDGEFQMGVASPEPRLSSNGDLTVTDNLTGLVWSKDANSAGSAMKWQAALDYIKHLNDQQYLGYNDWRLPNINELASLYINGYGGFVNIPYSMTNGWIGSDSYWSSSTFLDSPDKAMVRNLYNYVYLSNNYVSNDSKSSDYYVWPVRGGQSGTLGSLVFSPTTPVFPDTTIGSHASPVIITLTNSGGGLLSVSEISLTGVDSGQFTVAPGGSFPCANLTPTLDAGARCTLAVTFSPTSGGAKTAALHLVSNDAVKPIQDVTLTGSGYTITTSAGANGTISASQMVDYGANSTPIVVTPNIGYVISSLIIDSVSQTIADSKSITYTFFNVTTTHTVLVTFAIDPTIIHPQTITFGPLVDRSYSTTGYSVNATASSGLPVTLSSQTPETCSVLGYTVQTVALGTCTIRASQAGYASSTAGYASYAAATDVDRSFTINKANATIVLGNLTQSYTGAPRTPTAITTPAGLAILWTGAPQTNAGVYPVTATINDPNYQGETSGTFTLNSFPWGNGNWSSAGTLAPARYAHTATLLNNGKLLVAGGTISDSNSFNSCALYDENDNSWSTAGSMISGRAFHTATRLSSGKVLVVGGYKYNSGATLNSVELYDPVANSWSAVSALATARAGHAAVLLANGKVLISGGEAAVGVYLTSAELYDPATDTWVEVDSLSVTRSRHTATLLNNGKVLVAGGGNDSNDIKTAEIFDPGSNNWSSAGTLVNGHDSATATLLVDGKVLLVGGKGTPSVERFDPSTATWSTVASLPTRSSNHAATLLSDGRVLVTGGFDSLEFSSATEIYDPALDTWESGSSLSVARSFHTATLLLSGKVLVSSGGTNCSGSVYSCSYYAPLSSYYFAPLSSNEIYTPIISASQSQSITFGALTDKTYGAADFAVSATATSGLPVNFSSQTPATCSVSGTTVHLVAVGTCTVRASQTGNTSYAAAADVDRSFTVNKENQATLSVTGPVSVTYGSTATISTSGGSGSGAMSYSAGSSTGCTVDVGTGVITVIDASGTCSVTASRAADSNYNATTSVAQNVTLSKGSQTTLTVTGPASVTFGSTGTISTSGGSGSGTMSYSAGASTGCSVNSGTGVITITNASGTCSVTASKTTDSNYNAATSLAQNVTLNKAGQTISFTNPGSKTYGTNPALSATATSGLSPVLTSATPNVCTISSGVLTFVTTGSCTINADQLGNGNYNAATQVQQSFTVNKAATTSAVVSSKNVSTVGDSVTFTATVVPATATGSVTFKDGSTTLGTGTISNGTATYSTTAVSSGAHSITAVYGGDGNYNGSTSPAITQTVQVVITVTNSVAGLSFTVDSVTYTTPQTFIWTPGTSHAIGTTQYQSVTADSRYSFSNWSDSGVLIHNISVPSVSTTYTATFVRQYLMTTAISPVSTAAISASVNGASLASNWLTSGTQVQLTAFPYVGYTFSGWSGSVTGAANPVTVTVTGPMNVTATTVPLAVVSLAGGAGITRTATSDYSSRTWIFSLANTGTAAANNSRITGLTLTANNATCKPTIKTTFPLSLGTIAAKVGVATGSIVIDFTTSGCLATTKYTAAFTYTYDGGSVATKSYSNQLR